MTTRHTPGGFFLSMNIRTDDLRIREIRELITPDQLASAHPCTDAGRRDRVARAPGPAPHPARRGRPARRRHRPVLDPRSAAALEYAARLREQRERFKGELEIVMRVYFEKPRTTVGWKGLINDPDLDGSFRINEGLRLARGLLLDLNQLGVPAGCEFLDMITPQYIARPRRLGRDRRAHHGEPGAPRARVGLSCPVGFKNGTDGNVKIAVDAIQAAAQPHHFLAVTKQGRSAIATTPATRTATSSCAAARRRTTTPRASTRVCAAISRRRPAPAGDDRRQPRQQQQAVRAAGRGRTTSRADRPGERRIVGVMVESHLVAGRQDLRPASRSSTGRASPTPASAGDSVEMLERLARRWRRGEVRLKPDLHR